MMDFSCVGFDVRVWPCDGRFSCGESEWSQHEGVYRRIRQEYGLSENLYQLLEVNSKVELDEITSCFREMQDCRLVAVFIPRLIAEFNNRVYGYPIGYDFGFDNFRVCGIDVGDINGFFSVLSNPDLIDVRGTDELMGVDDVDGILGVLQLARFLDKGHSPYAVIKLMMLDSSDDSL